MAGAADWPAQEPLTAPAASGRARAGSARLGSAARPRTDGRACAGGAGRGARASAAAKSLQGPRYIDGVTLGLQLLLTYQLDAVA